MFRRVSLSVAPRAPAAAVALAVVASASPSHLSCLRYCSTNTGSSGNSNTYNNNNNTRYQGGGQQQRRIAMPPAFDIVHWNDEDISKGYMLRVLHRDSFIVLDYYRQARKGVQPTVGEGGRYVGGSTNRAERVVTVTLPPVYIARFLGVLEGRMEKVEVQSRFTNATFTPDSSKGKHHYTLQCTSMKPTTGQQQSADGTDVNEEAIEWAAHLDPASSLMLHRFLTQALQYNTGFCRQSALN